MTDPTSIPSKTFVCPSLAKGIVKRTHRERDISKHTYQQFQPIYLESHFSPSQKAARKRYCSGKPMNDKQRLEYIKARCIGLCPKVVLGYAVVILSDGYTVNTLMTMDNKYLLGTHIGSFDRKKRDDTWYSHFLNVTIPNHVVERYLERTNTDNKREAYAHLVEIFIKCLHTLQAKKIKPEDLDTPLTYIHEETGGAIKVMQDKDHPDKFCFVTYVHEVTSDKWLQEYQELMSYPIIIK